MTASVSIESLRVGDGHNGQRTIQLTRIDFPRQFLQQGNALVFVTVDSRDEEGSRLTLFAHKNEERDFKAEVRCISWHFHFEQGAAAEFELFRTPLWWRQCRMTPFDDWNSVLRRSHFGG